MSHTISVQEAQRLLDAHTVSLKPVTMSLLEASGSVLADSVKAPADSPPFNRSAVDGFAIRKTKAMTDGVYRFRLNGECKAGDSPYSWKKGDEAIRIFTGAPVPIDTFTVIMQEFVDQRGSEIIVDAGKWKEGTNIRYRGHHFHKGDMVLESYTTLTPAAIGLLASLGIARVKVFAAPRIHILVTGNELQSPGMPLSPGMIYESNSFSLLAALQHYGFHAGCITAVEDHPEQLSRRIASALQASDVLILTGGVSVGKYDHVASCLKSNRVKTLFHKVAQKPGKPFLVGYRGTKTVFGLPGNPAAVLVCYYQYILPFLLRLTHRSVEQPVRCSYPLAHDLRIKGDRDQFLRAFVQEGQVTVFDNQDSDNLWTFAKANALVYLGKNTPSLTKGDKVSVQLIR